MDELSLDQKISLPYRNYSAGARSGKISTPLKVRNIAPKQNVVIDKKGRFN